MFHINENKIINDQIIGLNYNQHNYEIIKLIAKHRGMTNNYLNGNRSLKKEIVKIENNLNILEKKFIDFDKNNLNILQDNPSFIEILNKWEFLKLNNTIYEDKQTVFKMHTELILKMIELEKLISQKTYFSDNYNSELNYVSKLLEESIPKLTEITGRLRDIGSDIFIKGKISKQERKDLLDLIYMTQEKLSFIKNNKPLIHEDNYIQLNKLSQQILNDFYITTKVLYTHTLDNDTPNYDPKKFFTLASKTIKAQNLYYENLVSIYNEKSYKKLEDHKQTFIWLLTGFIVILAGSVYIFTAFYTSVIGSLEKLKLASSMVAEGRYNTIIHSTTNDEIGDAITAFNNMSDKLNTNILFLDAYKMAIDETSIVSKTDKKGVITYVNKQFCEVSGYTKDELLGRHHNIVRHPDMPKEAFADMWKTIQSKKIWKGIVKNKKKDDSFYIVDATIIPLLDKEGEIIEYVAVRHDITALEMQKEKHKIDELTKLPNRIKLMEDIENFKDPVLMRINLNNFSNLNDFYGYVVGDKVMIHIANLLDEISKDLDCMVYKLHADDFAILFKKGYHTKETFENIIVEITNLIESSDINCDETSCIHIKIRSGIAFLDESKDTLYSDANIALKHAKIEHKSYLIYDQSLRKDDDYAENMIWIKKIQDAIADNRIRPFFQPIIDNETGLITKYESLVRLIDKDGSIITPYHFLDIAKQANLYSQITKIMIDKSFKKFSQYENYEFSVNLTIDDITNHDTVNFILSQLSSYKNPKRVIFEIVESEEIQDYKEVNSFIKKIKTYGAKIAIDDFGSGYANFEHILTLDADFIKIDGSLIKNINRDRNALIITEAIIEFSKKLNRKTIVEYVHNEDVYEIVKAYGANYSQGFHLGEPKEELIDENSAKVLFAREIITSKTQTPLKTPS
jgi:PAS domain S-box-containing protein/diguanylate cyclase (GGDEF)-like protein